MKRNIDYLVIGAGPAGIAAARTLKDAGKNVVIYEQQSTYGGLCGSFNINDCTFDKFVHLTFADATLRNTWFNSSNLISHKPVASNFYKGKWLAHPAINNLAPLSFRQKAKILLSFLNRPSECDWPYAFYKRRFWLPNEVANLADSDDFWQWNYYCWTKCVYGEYFANEFVEKYTKKYWGVSGCNLDTSWVSGRFQEPTFKSIFNGMFKKNENATFYTPMMYYPTKNELTNNTGYVQIFDKPVKDLEIIYNQKCVEINPDDKICTFDTGDTVEYKQLITTMPMPEIVTALSNHKNYWNDRQYILSQFNYTAGYMVSLIFNAPKITDKLWFYVYDSDIPPARFYSPSLCAPGANSPNNISTLQGEIYVPMTGVNSTLSDKQLESYYLNKTIDSLKRLNIDISTLAAADIRRENYANILFTSNTAHVRQDTQNFLDSVDVVNCGRFGEWQYLWTHQAWQSGVDAATKVIKKHI